MKMNNKTTKQILDDAKATLIGFILPMIGYNILRFFQNAMQQIDEQHLLIFMDVFFNTNW